VFSVLARSCWRDSACRKRHGTPALLFVSSQRCPV
jgi:hypothetical protein